jgi:tRNA-2-methylthio-N6-dimethylallyladenosine synthase
MINREPYIDLIIGPQSYHQINEKILQYNKKKKKIDETEFDVVSKFKYLSKIKNQSGKVSSFLTIQEGCDKFCHFCVVPYTRGPEYSRPFNQIMDEAKYLADNGTKELILLGQNVNAYNSTDGYRLSNLLLEIEKLSGIERVRYTTSHPKDMSEDLINVYKFTKKLMPLVHLPVQSGSNKILDLMNRKHTVKEYLKIFDKLKQINSNIEFSSDFIIGYPGEKNEDFKRTFDLIKKIKFINSYSFIFSPRPGTVAADLKLVDKKISMERLEKIQNELFKNQINMNKSFENKILDVLVENLTEDKTQVFGRSEHMTSVIFNGNKSDIGKIVKVKINRSNRSTLFGEKFNNSNQKVA